MAPSKAKPKPTKTRSQKEKGPIIREEPTSSIPLELQQLLLNVFRNSFKELLQSADFKSVLQELKGHLYNRDFLTAFGKEEYLEAYAARWSPSRALGYLQVFESLQKELQPLSKTQEKSDDEKWKVVCLGGGAGAEIVTLAGFKKLLDLNAGSDAERGKDMDIVVIDIADWTAVIDKLRIHITTAPPLSQYASTAAKAANTQLLDSSSMNVSFHQHDILNVSFATMLPLLEDANLVTLLFTLNELYTTSLSLTQTFLLNLTACLRPGGCLLVVDSPGSYSTVSLNGKEKKYPMQWLLDHTLLGNEDKPQWEKVKEEESTWFRLGEGLQYPIELENMRFQLYLYRRLG